MAGLYIHVPFCRSRCIYCDFYSTTYGEEWKSSFVSALRREMDLRHGELGDAHLHTLYIGGGTPSQLSPLLLQQVFADVADHFDLMPDAEVTLEVNPDDVSPALLDALRHTPVNRISMGAQTFRDELLRLLRRRHTAAQITDAVARCREYGYANLSVDLIYGLPHQTQQMWEEDVAQLLTLDVPHLSAYALSYEEGTPLMKMLEGGLVTEATDELSWQMYAYLRKETRKAGYEHYEISNFAKPGMYARHNSSYWDGTPYLGLGPGAHSYDGQWTRRANLHDLQAYLSAQGDVPHQVECLTEAERYNELVMTRLRTSRGLALHEVPEAYRENLVREALVHVQAGRLQCIADVYSLTEEGLFVSNRIISDLMY